tara:strand:- start:11 stop:409 length:399 start_codon:yes stop_codon:yes gene_type:complete
MGEPYKIKRRISKMNNNETIETMSKLVMTMMRFAHSMTTYTTFEAVFVSSNEIHMGGYISDQWTMWQNTPLTFATHWPLQFRMLVTVYDEMEYKKLGEIDGVRESLDIEAICAKAFKDCVKYDVNGCALRLE